MPTSQEIVAFELDRQKHLDALFKRTEPSPETLMCEAVKCELDLHQEGYKIAEGSFSYLKPDKTPIESLCVFCSESQQQPVEYPCKSVAVINTWLISIKIPCSHKWTNLPGNYTKKCDLCEMEQNIR